MTPRRLVPGAGVFVAALAVRAAYWFQAAGRESFAVPLVDAETYVALARGLGAPEAWFWQPPFYPAFLAVCFGALGGADAARGLQLVLGAVTCVLVYRVGREHAGETAGLAAGFLLALYGPAVFFDLELLGTGWACFWAALLLALAPTVLTSTRPAVLGVCGLVCAAAVLTRPTFLPFVLVVGIAATRHGGRRPRALAAFAVAVVVPWGAWAVATHEMTGRLGFLPASGGLNLWIGNNPERAETVTIRPGWEWERLTRVPRDFGVTERSRTGAFFARRTLSYAATEPIEFAAGLGTKTLELVSSRELPRNVDPYLERDRSVLLSWLLWKRGGFGFPFGVLLPLAVLGAVAGRRLPWWIGGFVIAYGAGIVLVFVSARYRMPLVPALAVFAGCGVAAFLGDRRRLVLGAPLAIVAAVVAILPGPFPAETVDHGAERHYLLGRQAASRGDGAAALEHFRQVLARAPEHADAWTASGNLFARSGRLDLAEARFERAIEANPDHAIALANLARIVAGQGDRDRAHALLSHAVEVDPHNPSVLADHATVLSWLGRYREALPFFEEAAAARPDDPDLLFRWGRVLEAAGSLDEARALFARVLALDPDHTGAMTAAGRLNDAE